MLRRVARVLRVVLLITGIVVVAWTVVSRTTGTAIYTKFSRGHFIASGGTAELWIRQDDAGNVLRAPLMQRINVGGVRYALLQCPYFTLALLCLAWPVTSLVLARRRHKRGFPVEPKGGGEAVSTSESSPARASDR